MGRMPSVTVRSQTSAIQHQADDEKHTQAGVTVLGPDGLAGRLPSPKLSSFSGHARI